MNGPDSELDVVGRLAEAFLARYRRGERPSLTEYVQAHPELAEQIRELFPALVVLEELGSVEGRRTGPAPATSPSRVDEQLGDYRILREVGRGGMGVVYEAVQESLGRHVALKVLSGQGAPPSTHLERFKREARAAARLHHPNIVPVHGVGEHEGVHFYAMQFIQGQGLDEVLKEVIRLRRPSPTTVSSDSPTAHISAASESATELPAQPEAEYFRSVARMGGQIAEALDYAHKQGVLHRDIKPSNLLLDAHGAVWITDFGLARTDGADDLTHTGDIVGTLRYMAPERFGGWSDPRSDVYALGVTLYELLTLRPAFTDANRARLIERVTHEDPPQPRKIDRSIPRDLETIVLKAIDKEPGRRYPTAGEMAMDLGRFLVGEPVLARRIGLGEWGVKWVKRRPAVAALVAVSAAAVLALLIGTLVYNARLVAALETAIRHEKEKTRQLAVAKVSEAQARRNSGLVGRRFDSLEALRKAKELFHSLGELDDPRTLELRNEAIICLTLADLKRGKERPRTPGWSEPFGFDPTLQHSVVASTAEDNPEVRLGLLSIRRLADDQEIARLPSFGARVSAVQFSPDGRYLAANYERGQRYRYIWDLTCREAILKVTEDGNYQHVAFSPDSQRVALARPDGTIRIHELPSGTIEKDLPSGLVGTPYFHPDGRRLALVNGKTVQLCNLSDGKELATFKHTSGVVKLAWRSDGQVFATGCVVHEICLWDVASSAQPLRTLRGHFGPVRNLAFNCGGDLLVGDTLDATPRLWDPMTGQQLVSKPRRSYSEQPPGERAPLGNVAFEHQFSPDDTRLDCAWQVAAGRECRTFHSPQLLRSVALSPNGRLLASETPVGVQLWDLAASREGEKHLATLPGVVGSARFESRGDYLITSGSGGLQRWPITPGPKTGGLRIGPPQTVVLPAGTPLPLYLSGQLFATSADGQTLAITLQHDQLFVLDRESTQVKLHIESPHLGEVAFSPDGRWLATGSRQGWEVKVWDAHSGQLAHTFDLREPEENSIHPTGGPDGKVPSRAVFSPDGKWLVTSTSAEHRFWEVGSWQKKHRLSGGKVDLSFGSIVFSPDGRMLAVLHSMGDVLRLIDPETEREFARVPTWGRPYGFSPDGSQLVTSAGSAGAFQVWDLRLIRRQLAEMGLDWNLPRYPPPSAERTTPLRVEVLAR